jgi:hypothetical protein
MLGHALKAVEEDCPPFNSEILTPGRLLRMASGEGIRVVCNAIIPKGKKSLIAYWNAQGSETACICIRQCMSYEAFWFLLAHELGHYFLHIALPRGIVPYRSDVVQRTYDRFEDEANVMAAMCMLPNSLLRFWEDDEDLPESEVAKILIGKSVEFCNEQFGFTLKGRSERNIRNRIWKFRQLKQMLKEKGRLELLPKLDAQPDVRALVSEFDGNLPEVIASGRPTLLV